MNDVTTIHPEQFHKALTHLFYESSLKLDHIAVFTFLYGILQHKKICAYRNDSLMIIARCKKRRLDQVLNDLERDGYIVRIGHGYNRKFMLGNKLELTKQAYLLKIAETNQIAQKPIIDAQEAPMSEQKSLEATNDANLDQQLNIDAQNAPMADCSNSTDIQHRRTKRTGLGASQALYNRSLNKDLKQQQQTPSSNSQTDLLEKPTPKPVVVFDKIIDQDLLTYKNSLPSHLQPDLDDTDFLKAAKQHMDAYQSKMNTNFTHAYRAFKKLIKTQLFFANGFLSRSQKQQQEADKLAAEQRLNDIVENSKAKAIEAINPDYVNLGSMEATLGTLKSILGTSARPQKIAKEPTAIVKPNPNHAINFLGDYGMSGTSGTRQRQAHGG